MPEAPSRWRPRHRQHRLVQLLLMRKCTRRPIIASLLSTTLLSAMSVAPVSFTIHAPPTNFAYVVDAAQVNTFSSLARTRGSISKTGPAGMECQTCNPASIATLRSSTSANMPASLKPFPSDTTTPWMTSAPACAERRGPASLRQDGHSRQGHHSTKGRSPAAPRPSRRRTTLAQRSQQCRR